MHYKRIHIIGSPGSGKTTLANKLAAHYKIQNVMILDEIYWDNDAPVYGTKADEAERDRKLQEFVQQESWITEGVFYKWVIDSFERADIIVLLETPLMVRNYRFLRRYIPDKLGIEKEYKKNTLKTIIKGLIWAHGHAKRKMPRIMELTDPYASKRYTFKSNDDAFRFLTQSN